MTPSLPWLLLALPAALPLGITALNLLTWPRGSRGGARHPGDPDAPGARVSVLIPARNEEATIGAAVQSVFDSGFPLFEVVVFNDASTDRTGAILADLQARHPRLRVVDGTGLPPGWVGKPHACHRLSQEARGDVFVYLDADVTVHPGGLQRLWALATGGGVPGRAPDLVTAVPQQVMGTFAERLLMPVLHLTYTAWLPLLLIPLASDPRFLAANGQVLLVGREALARVGGWQSVRHEIVDDMAICRRVKESGGKVVFADGHRLASCRMYTSGAELWAGFSKNLYEGIGGHPLGLLAVVLLYTTCFVLPFVALPVAAALGAAAWTTAAGVGVALNLLTRTLLALRHGHGIAAVLLHPLAILGLLGIAVNSALWSRKGAIQWAGRTYAARAQRSAP